MDWILIATAVACIAGTYALLQRRNRKLHARLAAIEQVRRDFVANVSHELRTPLTIISGFAETLAEDDVDPEARQRFAGAIVANAHRMQRIVDDLLDLSRIESGGWVPRPGNVDLREIAADTLNASQFAATEKGLTLEITLNPAATVVYADRTALRQVLGNLVENAVRHTAAGTVTIFTSRDSERNGVWVGVRDTGIGMAPEHVSRIFERFYRVATDRARESGGTGLGLAIVKHLVEAHGGIVRATSKLGQGTAVLAFFPVEGNARRS